MPLKIALLTYSTKPRGSVIHTLELAQALHELGHRPCVFALDKDGKGFHRSAEFNTCSVPANVCDGGIDPLIQQRIDEFVSFFQQHAQSYDIYHAQDCLSANALAILRSQGRIPHFVRTVHHIESFRSPYLQDCQEKSIHLPDRCCCVSKQWQQVLKADYEINAHRVVNGVSERFSPFLDGLEAALKKSLDLQSGPIYLTVGGIEPRKNSINLLTAFDLVRRHQPNAQLIIAGGATLFDYRDYREQFMALAKNYALQDSLVLPGVIADAQMPALYRLADGFVFPSVKEGWGLVVLEAIASGLPVVTSNQPPFTEFLTQDDAYLVNPEDVDEMASAMLKMTAKNSTDNINSQLSNSQLSNSQLSSSIRRDYSWRTSAQMHLNLYQQLLPVPS